MMPDELLNFRHRQCPTSERPLLGITVLMVEDSRFASEAMRLLCLRSGARIRRAGSLAAARRHLQIYNPSLAIIDMGLPDGSGAELIAELARATPRLPVVLGTSGDDGAFDQAMAAGADGFLAKPVASLAQFQSEILRHLPDHARPKGPHLVSDEVIEPDPIALQDDLAHVADILSVSSDDGLLDYIAQFLRGVARSAGDQTLENAAELLAAHRAASDPTHADVVRLAGMVNARLQTRIVI